ncbi:MAG: type IV pilin protein [Xenococcaceae cyanobacterium]
MGKKMRAHPLKKNLFYHLTIYQNNGFTLIELLVVVIIVGILAAIATPNLIGQIGKARETEAKIGLASLSRSQQAYRFEKQVFADLMSRLELNVALETNYYDFPNPSTANSSLVKHQAIAKNPTGDLVRNHAIGVYYDSGLFDVVMCQSQGIGDAVDAPDTSSGACTNNGIRLN